MKEFVGIGARVCPPQDLMVIKLYAQYLGSLGYTCRTGACRGPDQAFAEGTMEGSGYVKLFLPWFSYEKDWIVSLRYNPQIRVLNTQTDIQAMNSVRDYHPNPDALKPTVVKLHARNFLILGSSSAPIICWTPNGAVVGGTGQALRIANDRGASITNLGNPQTMTEVKRQLRARGYPA